MKKTYILSLSLCLLVFVSSCVKDQRVDGLKLIAEGGRNGDSKMIIDGDYSDWVAGDELRINGTTTTVQMIDRAAYASGGGFEAPFYGIYPASIYRGNDGNSYTVNIPGTYTYMAADGKQVLQSPMAGYAESGNYIFFRHLTSAVTVQITNYYGFTVIVDSVLVISNSYKLHGDVTFTLGADISISASAKAGGDTVVMLGGGLQIISGNTVNVQVPVLPQGSGNLFTLQVKVHKYNNTDVKRRFDSTQPNSRPLARNQIGYAPMTVGFTFTASATKSVIISQGNLQYNVNSDTWRFAANQYDAIGDAAGNNVFDDTRATQDAWIDLFGWGTSGWNNGNALYMPYSNGKSGSDVYGYGYGPKVGYTSRESLVGDYVESDWGFHNSISNGGGSIHLWRTLTSVEWQKVLITRNASTINGVSDARYAKAAVNGINGLIIFPDTYTHPNGVSLPSNINETGSGGWTGNVYSLSDWSKIEASGAVFLPITARTGVGTVTQKTTGNYWSTTFGATNGKAYYMYFSNMDFSASAQYDRYYGMAVRVVKDID